MSFQDHGKDNVQSLLALLRSTQDDLPPTQPLPSFQPSQPSIPSKRQLDDLLSSLGSKKSAQTVPSAPTNGSPALSKSPRHLIEPFGPVGHVAGPSRPSFDPLATSARSSSQTEPDRSGSPSKPSNRSADPGFDTFSFAKSLPILTDLISNETFTAEIRKMKADQDALERRLWAKQEKVKAEHERVIKAEKDIARIARRPIPPDKQAAWADKLAADLDEFYRQNCLTAMDGLALRQRRRLKELGVPGLGEGDDEKSLERMRRIMDVLEAGMEE